jgi:hypothetical protein
VVPPDGKLGPVKLRCCAAAVAYDGWAAAEAPPQLSATGSVAPSDDSAPPAPPAALALKVLPAMLANPQEATSCRGSGYSNRCVSTQGCTLMTPTLLALAALLMLWIA